MSLHRTAPALFHLVSAQTLGRLITAALLPLTLRVMPAEEYASLGLYAAVAQMLGILTAGIGAASGRIGREEIVCENSIARTLAASLTLRLPLVMATLAIMLVWRQNILHFAHLPPIGWWMLAVAVVIGNLTSVTELLQAQERFAVASWLSQAPVFLNIAAALAVIFHLVPARGIFLVAGFFAGTVVLAAGNAWAVRHHWGRLRFDTVWTRKLFVLAAPFFLNGVSVYLLDYADMLVVRGVMPLAQVGIYGATLTLTAYLRTPVQMLSPLIMPRVTSHFLGGHTERIRWFYGRILPQMVFLLTQAVAVMLLASPLIGLIVGRRFALAEDPFRLLAAGLVPLLITWTITPLFYAWKRVGYHVAAYVIMGLANTTLALHWTPDLGVRGAALARLSADVIGCLLHVLAARRLGFNVVGALVWSLPLWCVLAATEFSLPAWQIGSLWIFTMLAAIATARRARLFDAESADFLKRLGLPQWTLRTMLVIQRWILAGRPA